MASRIKINTVESVTNRFNELITKINNTKRKRRFLTDVIELIDDMQLVKTKIEKASCLIDLVKENDSLFKMLWQLDDIYYNIK
jgi:outer membrane protein assembly factor BamD (BamD/ComL family)